MTAYAATADLVPLYAVYALYFRDHGLSAGAMSTLFVLWSLSSFVFEVPSGAWADSVDRRLLLVLSGLVMAAGFASWMLWPSYLGFLAGFLLWGLAGALDSGTYEALVYDELAAAGRTSSYARVRGLGRALGMLGSLVAVASAGPLMQLGGYTLVGWASVGAALVHAGFAVLLPRARRVEAAGLGDRYLTVLRDGLHEAARVPVVRRALLVAAAMLGATAFDEYFNLVGREHGLTAEQVPWMMALVVAGQVAGTALAGPAARLSARTIATLYGMGSLGVAAGVLVGTWPGYAVLAVGYGLVNNGFLVAETRLQDAIEGRARATVISVSGLLSEVFAVLVFAAVAVGSLWFSVSTTVAVVVVPLLLNAVAASRWLPEPAHVG